MFCIQFKILWIKFQWKCCGVDGAADYPEGKLPASCCAPSPDPSAPCTVANAYDKVS